MEEQRRKEGGSRKEEKVRGLREWSCTHYICKVSSVTPALLIQHELYLAHRTYATYSFLFASVTSKSAPPGLRSIAVACKWK